MRSATDRSSGAGGSGAASILATQLRWTDAACLTSAPTLSVLAEGVLRAWSSVSP